MQSRRIHPKAQARLATMTDELAAVISTLKELIDCVPQSLEYWRDTLAAAGHRFSIAKLQRSSGMDAGEMLDRLLPRASKLQRKLLLKQQGERDRRDELHRVRAFAGVRDLFARLKQEGATIGAYRFWTLRCHCMWR